MSRALGVRLQVSLQNLHNGLSRLIARCAQPDGGEGKTIIWRGALFERHVAYAGRGHARRPARMRQLQGFSVHPSINVRMDPSAEGRCVGLK
jgi:hypothetical protein